MYTYSESSQVLWMKCFPRLDMILFWTVDDEVLKIGMVSQWLRWVGDMIIIKKPSAKTKVI